MAITPEKRLKLEDTAIKCRLIGYSDDENPEQYKAYKLYVEETGKVIYSKNVTFPDPVQSIVESNLVDYPLVMTEVIVIPRSIDDHEASSFSSAAFSACEQGSPNVAESPALNV